MNALLIEKDDIYAALRDAVGEKPQPAYELLQRVVADLHVGREQVVAALWDLVEDEGFIYDAAAKVHRPAS